MEEEMPIGNSKGQITIPRDILIPRNKDIRSLKGILQSKKKRPVSLKEMDDAIAEGSSEM